MNCIYLIYHIMYMFANKFNLLNCGTFWTPDVLGNNTTDKAILCYLKIWHLHVRIRPY